MVGLHDICAGLFNKKPRDLSNAEALYIARLVKWNRNVPQKIKERVKVELPQNDKHLILGLVQKPSRPAKGIGKPYVKKEVFRSFIFDNHEWIEPEETITDTIPLYLSQLENALALNVELKIFTKKINWSESWLIPFEDSAYIEQSRV